jgi:hypothetical protein
LKWREGSVTTVPHHSLAESSRRKKPLQRGHNLADSGDAILEDPLDTVRKRQLAHWTTLAGTLQFDLHDTILRDIHKLNITAISLQSRADKFEHLFDVLSIDHETP